MAIAQNRSAVAVSRRSIRITVTVSRRSISRRFCLRFLYHYGLQKTQSSMARRAPKRRRVSARTAEPVHDNRLRSIPRSQKTCLRSFAGRGQKTCPRPVWRLTTPVLFAQPSGRPLAGLKAVQSGRIARLRSLSLSAARWVGCGGSALGARLSADQNFLC